jgi:anti-sigma regulatory factor (Ser/Thr protein kinase)
MTITTTVRPTGHPGYSQTLPCKAESARTARMLVRTALAAWGLDAITGDSELVVSELVANTVQHTSCRHIRVTITRFAPGLVRIGIADKSRTPPVRRAPCDDDVRGRGLALVDMLTVRWGTDPKRWGKCVWAELESAGEAGG